MGIHRDKFGQQRKKMSPADLDALHILEEVSTDPGDREDKDRSLLAFLTDIKDIYGVK